MFTEPSSTVMVCHPVAYGFYFIICVEFESRPKWPVGKIIRNVDDWQVGWDEDASDERCGYRDWEKSKSFSSLLPSFDNSRCFSLYFVYTTLPFESFLLSWKAECCYHELVCGGKTWSGYCNPSIIMKRKTSKNLIWQQFIICFVYLFICNYKLGHIRGTLSVAV